MFMFELTDKRTLVVGKANEHSIAWGVTQALQCAGAELATSYLNEKAAVQVRPLAHNGCPGRLDVVVLSDVGVAAAFLASEHARNITGSVLHIDASRHIIA